MAKRLAVCKQEFLWDYVQEVVSKVDADSLICEYCQRDPEECDSMASCHPENPIDFLGIACYEVDDNE